MDDFIKTTHDNALLLEKKLQDEIDDRVYKIGLDMEVGIAESEKGDWSCAKDA